MLTSTCVVVGGTRDATQTFRKNDNDRGSIKMAAIVTMDVLVIYMDGI